jgi:hypothetical protein
LPAATRRFEVGDDIAIGGVLVLLILDAQQRGWIHGDDELGSVTAPVA